MGREGPCCLSSVEKHASQKTCPVVTRAIIKLKQVDVRGNDWEKRKVGWSEKASRAITLETQKMRSRASGDLGEEDSRPREQ